MQDQEKRKFELKRKLMEDKVAQSLAAAQQAGEPASIKRKTENPIPQPSAEDQADADAANAGDMVVAAPNGKGRFG